MAHQLRAFPLGGQGLRTERLCAVKPACCLGALCLPAGTHGEAAVGRQHWEVTGARHGHGQGWSWGSCGCTAEVTDLPLPRYHTHSPTPSPGALGSTLVGSPMCPCIPSKHSPCFPQPSSSPPFPLACLALPPSPSQTFFFWLHSWHMGEGRNCTLVVPSSACMYVCVCV